MRNTSALRDIQILINNVTFVEADIYLCDSRMAVHCWKRHFPCRRVGLQWNYCRICRQVLAMRLVSIMDRVNSVTIG